MRPHGTWPFAATLAALTVVSALTGCASSGDSAAHRTVTLTVHVSVTGGPELPSGQMAVSNAPQADTRVTARSGSHEYEGTTSADGAVTLHLPAAATPYTVTAPCGASRTVRITDQARTIRLTCQVP